MGPYKDSPRYAEASWGQIFGSTSRWTSSFHFGLHFRMSRTRDDATGERSAGWEIGPAFNIGLRLRPWSNSSFMITTTGRLTAYFPQHGGPSLLTGIAHRVGKYQLDVGVLIDHVTTRVQTVMAFNEQRTVEDEGWRPILMLTIAHYTHDDPR